MWPVDTSDEMEWRREQAIQEDIQHEQDRARHLQSVSAQASNEDAPTVSEKLQERDSSIATRVRAQ